MSFGVLNLLMLVGLAAVALPVIVHLISRRKFDVVQWGAMQFLELGRKTRRRIRIEELLLLLLRMGLLVLLVLALARPWGQGGVFASFGSSTNRDVVLVIDGSYSMGWEGRAVTPYAAAVQWAHELLEGLHGSDTVMVLDARDQVHNITDAPTSHFDDVRRALDDLPEPSGTSNLAVAAGEAVKVLSRTSNVARDVVILTDRQSLPWQLDDATAWSRFDDLCDQPSVRPNVWVVDVTDGESDERGNFAVGRVELSRELSVPGFPIRIRTTIEQSEGVATRRRVSLEVNGQPLEEKTVTINVPAGGTVPVEFEHPFAAVGSYVVAVVLESDNLPGDNRGEAAVVVESGVPVLLVDGDPQRDPVRSETFFARSALSASGNDSPWVVAETITADELDADAIGGHSVVVLANVARLSAAQVGALKDFVSRGGGLAIAPGDRVESEFYNGELFEDGGGLLPAQLGDVKREEDYVLKPVNLESQSLTASWMGRFKTGAGIDLLDARFARWWQLAPATAPADRDAGAPSDASVGAAFETTDPFLVWRNFGSGTVVQLAVPLDADWGTLPSKNDYVPFLHELVFWLAGSSSGRNLDVGMAIQLPLRAGSVIEDWRVVDPNGADHELDPAGDELRPQMSCSETTFPGIYQVIDAVNPERPEFFVVNSDRSESDLTPLDEIDRQQLSENDRLAFVATAAEFQAAAAQDASRTELWWLLMLVVLGLLVSEVVMTRRMVQGGHEAVEALPDEMELVEA